MPYVSISTCAMRAAKCARVVAAGNLWQVEAMTQNGWGIIGPAQATNRGARNARKDWCAWRAVSEYLAARNISINVLRHAGEGPILDRAQHMLRHTLETAGVTDPGRGLPPSLTQCLANASKCIVVVKIPGAPTNARYRVDTLDGASGETLSKGLARNYWEARELSTHTTALRAARQYLRLRGAGDAISASLSTSEPHQLTGEAFERAKALLTRVGVEIKHTGGRKKK